MSYECKTGLDLNGDFLNWRYIFLDIRGTTAGGYYKFLSLDFCIKRCDILCNCIDKSAHAHNKYSMPMCVNPLLQNNDFCSFLSS